MASPTKIKTWVKYSAYVAPGDGPTPQPGQNQSASDSRLMFFLLKETFLAAGWTVVASCGYHDAAWHYGAADHWTDAAAVRWKEADNKFGWIVLRNASLHSGGNGFQLCIALVRGVTETQYGTMCFALEGGFSGGSEYVRPTAVDEVLVYNNQLMTGYVYSSFSDNVMNIWYTTDGTSFRVWWGNGLSNLILNVNPPWLFERLVDAPTWMDKPVVAGIMRWDITEMFRKSPLNGPRRLYFCCDDILKNEVMLSAEAIQGSGTLADHASCQAPDLGGNWPIFPVSVISNSPLVNGFIGRLADMWAVPSAIAFGDYMPGDGSREFVVMHDLLIGNDGTAVPLP